MDEFIRFKCGMCGKPLKAYPNMVGKAGRCSKCGQRFVVPAAPIDHKPHVDALEEFDPATLFDQRDRHSRPSTANLPPDPPPPTFEPAERVDLPDAPPIDWAKYHSNLPEFVFSPVSMTARILMASMPCLAYYFIKTRPTGAFSNKSFEENAIFVFAWIAILLMYFLPGIIAYSRIHPNRDVIFILNYFTACTLIGWVMTDWWAFHSADTASRQYIRQVIVKEEE